MPAPVIIEDAERLIAGLLEIITGRGRIPLRLQRISMWDHSNVAKYILRYSVGGPYVLVKGSVEEIITQLKETFDADI